MPLLWRTFLGNAAVLGVATLTLALSPATVSFPLAAREAVVLGVGLAVMLGVNYALLRRAVTPLERLAGVMRAIDPLSPGRRSELPAATAEVADLARAFDDMLDRLELERRDSARRALAAQEAERLRVARELHDEVGQALTAVVLQLERARAATRGESAARVVEAREAARATLEEVRAIARNLRPEALDDLGLAAALRQLCAEAERAGVAVERRVASGLELLPETEVVVYRVAQEAVTDALRHSGAEHLQLVPEPAWDGGARLLVADDGSGFDRAADGGGLRGMRERALLAGGRARGLRAPGLRHGRHPDGAVTRARILLADDHAMVRRGLRMLSMHDSEQYLYEALKAGASGYVLKSGADRDLLQACRAALRGEPFPYPAAVSRLIGDLLARPEERPDPLTPRERQVVKLIAEAHTRSGAASWSPEVGSPLRADGRRRPWVTACAAASMETVRVMVLWNPCGRGRAGATLHRARSAGGGA